MGVERATAADSSSPPAERDRLIEAMARCCLERGYPETTAADVAAMASLPESAFSHHFADKESCALAAVETILALGMAQVSESFLADRSERDSALAALHGLLGLFAARPAMANLAFVSSRQGIEGAAPSRYESGFAILTAMLDRLRADQVGEGEPPTITARAAIGGGEALVRRELAAGRAEQLPRILPDLVYGAAVPFLGQQEALRLAQRGRELLQGTTWE